MGQLQMALKDCDEKFSQWVDYQTVPLIIHFVWEEKWSETQTYTNLWEVVNVLAGIKDLEGKGLEVWG